MPAEVLREGVVPHLRVRRAAGEETSDPRRCPERVVRRLSLAADGELRLRDGVRGGVASRLSVQRAAGEETSNPRWCPRALVSSEPLTRSSES